MNSFRIADIVKFQRGVSWSADQEHDEPGPGRVPVLRIPNVQERLAIGDLIYLSGVSDVERGRTAASKGWILLVGSNGNPERIGNAVLVEDETDFLFASFLVGVKCDPSRVFDRYMLRLLNSEGVRSHLRVTIRGSTGLQNINLPALGDFRIELPPLPTQRRIAEVLDALDDQIIASNLLLAKLRRAEEGLVAALLAPVRCAQRPGAETHNAALPNGWRSGRLDNFCTLQRGFDITRDEQRPGPYPVISSSGVTSFHDRSMVTRPGVITGRKGSLGKVYFTESDFWPHDTSLWVKDFHGNDPRFIAMLLRFLRLERYDAATSVPTLNRNNVHPLPVAIPELAEQRAIVAGVEKFACRADAEEASLAKLRRISSGLLNVLLTGHVRFPQGVAS